MNTDTKTYKDWIGTSGKTYRTWLRCPCCGHTVTAWTPSKGDRYYTCNKVKRCGWDSRSTHDLGA